jgi:phosphomannomutase
MCGVMPLDRGMAAEALAALEASQAKEPNRFRGDAGAALEKLGHRELAKQIYHKLIALAADADGDRPVVVAARRSVAANQAMFRPLSFVERHQI